MGRGCPAHSGRLPSPPRPDSEVWAGAPSSQDGGIQYESSRKSPSPYRPGLKLILNFLYVLTVTSLSNNNDQPKQKRTSQHAHKTIPLSPQFYLFYHSKRQEKKEPSSEPVIYSQLHGGLSGSPPRLTPCG